MFLIYISFSWLSIQERLRNEINVSASVGIVPLGHREVRRPSLTSTTSVQSVRATLARQLISLAYLSFPHAGAGYNGRISENLKLTLYNCTFAFGPVTTPSIRGTNEYSSSHSSGLGYFPPVGAWPTLPPWPSDRPSHSRSLSGSPARCPTAVESRRPRCLPPQTEFFVFSPRNRLGRAFLW